MDRRRLIRSAALGAAVAALPEWYVRDAEAREAQMQPMRRTPRGPNDAINIAVIGPGGSKGGFRQGLGDTRAIASQPNVRVVAVCDVDLKHRDEASEVFGGAAKYEDFRYVLARPDVDAVVIGTPDHWHSVIAGAAMRAGKDVYCEKPLTLTIADGQQLVKLARQYNTVFQVGSQQRSDTRFRMACELVRNGRIGKVKTVTAHLPSGPTGGPFEVKPVPQDFLFDMWLGPSVEVPYIAERTHGNFRHWYEYSGGMMTDWGAHHLDIAQWGLGRDGSGPVEISSKGKFLPFDPQGKSYNATPEFEVTYKYDDGVTLIATSSGENGVEFVGEDGRSIFVSRSRIGASDPKIIEDPLPANAVKLYASPGHARDFVNCIRERRRPICDVEIGHRSVSVCHLGNLSLRLQGRTLRWDPKKEEFKGDPEANSMRSRPMRGGWTVG